MYQNLPFVMSQMATSHFLVKSDPKYNDSMWQGGGEYQYSYWRLQTAELFQVMVQHGAAQPVSKTFLFLYYEIKLQIRYNTRPTRFSDKHVDRLKSSSD